MDANNVPNVITEENSTDELAIEENRTNELLIEGDEREKENNTAEVNVQHTNENPLQHKRRRLNNVFITENVDIKSILENTFEGKHILLWHKSNQCLDPRKRSRLVHFVIAGVLQKCERELKDNDFKILTQKIVDLFPKECPSVYYTSPIGKKHSNTGLAQRAGGKLLHKYNNLKRLPTEVYQSEQQSSVIRQVVTSENNLNECSNQVKDSVEWLKTQEEPWDTAEYHWKVTSDYRHSKLVASGGNNQVCNIYREWPILKTPRGYGLINIDFQHYKFTEEENAILNFTNFFCKANQVKIIRKDDYTDMLKNLFEVPELKEDDKVFIQLVLLCQMLPSTARISQGNKKYWKPSCAETLDGIIGQAKLYGDIEKMKADRRTFAASKKITVQPYIIVVGETDFSVESIYLCIDEVNYEIPTLLEALDLCFKSFHVLSAKYPPQSEQIWLMLQLGLYKFRTEWDPTIISVNEILNDMQCLPP